MDARENQKSKSNKINNKKNSFEKNNKRPPGTKCLEAAGDVIENDPFDNDNASIIKTRKIQNASENFDSNMSAEERNHCFLKEERKREELRHHLAMMEIIES